MADNRSSWEDETQSLLDHHGRKSHFVKIAIIGIILTLAVVIAVIADIFKSKGNLTFIILVK